MSLRSAAECCILNSGRGAWAFEPLADRLSAALRIEVSAEPRRFNYVLHLESAASDFRGESFIPLASIRVASDKRLTAEAFDRLGVPAPRTVLAPSFEAAVRFVAQHPESEWCLKFPTGCGASGHRMLAADSLEPANWPRPFVVQEFIRQQRPEVYRAYGAGGELFGWVVRRFPEGGPSSPWVAHVRGARYENLGEPPPEARAAARAALESTGLYDSFGCVDLLRRPSGEWLALEVGTDGLFNYVDRDLGDPKLEAELFARIADAFWRRANASR